jgi:transposase
MKNPLINIIQFLQLLMIRFALKALYEAPVQLNYATMIYSLVTELRSSVLTLPKWGIKKNSEGKNVFWFGYKGHFAVGTQNQHFL